MLDALTHIDNLFIGCGAHVLVLLIDVMTQNFPESEKL